MLTQLQCPSCNAPLAYDGTASTIQCPYCDNTFIVPVALRGTRAASPYWQTLDFSALDPAEQKAVMDAVEAIEELVERGDKIGAIKLYRTTFGSELAEARLAIDAVSGDSASAQRPVSAPAPASAAPTPSSYVGTVYDLHQPAPRHNGCLLATIIVLVLLVIGGVLASVFVTSRTVTTSIDDVMKVVQQASSVDVPAEVQQMAADLSGSPASLIGRFGAEGIGPGKFEDARAIAVDNAGRLYVGEYTSGRIQVFDTAGAFQAQWTLGENDFYVDQFAADRSGRLYIPYGGLGIYDGTTGNATGGLPPVDEDRFASGYTDSVAIGADGAIYAVWGDDIVRLNQAGEVTLRIENAIEAAVGGLETTTKIAVDGLGNIYALGVSQDVVVKFDSSGAFVDRVAVANRGAGDEESKLRAANALAVDSRGRIYVADIFGIKIYDDDGQYRATLDIPGVAFGLTIDDNDILSIAARTEVLRYQLQP